MTQSDNGDSVSVGVIGVGSMGQHHARVYRELPNVELVGIADTDDERAECVADKYWTTAVEQEQLLNRVDAVSVAVPTEFHHSVVSSCIERGVDVLVEKPFVKEPERGFDLAERAAANDTIIQIGHIERFNPAVNALYDIVKDLDIISIESRRLGPPPKRNIKDSVIFDLMIHDLDVVLMFLDEEPTEMNAVKVRGNDHAVATLQFPSDAMATLNTSRVTQKKVRTLEITAESCFVTVDYLNQTVKIHRHSAPEYIEEQGDVRYQHKEVIEQPTVENGEPLKRELRSFVEAVSTRSEPQVTAEQGLRAVEYIRRLDSLASSAGTENVLTGVESSQ